MPEDDDAAVGGALGLHPLEDALAVVEHGGAGGHRDGAIREYLMLGPLTAGIALANCHEVRLDRAPRFLSHVLPIHRGGGMVLLGLVEHGTEPRDALGDRGPGSRGGRDGHGAEAEPVEGRVATQ